MPDPIRESFRALILHEGSDEPRAEITTLTRRDLPEEDVLVEVAYSSMNYKDALAITGAGPVVRSYPMVPGIDLAGTVVESSSPDYRPGDRVILTGWGIGEVHWGGMAEYACVRSEHLVPIPDGRDAFWAMSVGTAGLTAMLALMALDEAGVRPAPRSPEPEIPGEETADASGARPERLPVLVTAASGGVGSIAVSLLAGAGHYVVASSGRHESWPFLRSLGAAEVIEREELEQPASPLEQQRWAGAVDSVGGSTLARVLAETRYGGAVASCGLVGGGALHTTVMPFILRAVRLLGVNSVLTPKELRLAAWERLARELTPGMLHSFTRVIPLEEVQGMARQMVSGRGRGRTVVQLRGEA
ncbi:MAG: oxidoreductase [Actinobacteria bacterium]|nr:oxidoreductase [Actinomycetota bacterium]